MAAEFKNWKETCNRFVAFLDIMGFRDRVFRESHEDVKNMLESLRPILKTIEIVAEDASETKSVPTIRPIIFSDSIILISDDESIQAFNWMISDTLMIICHALLNRIPIKGAIAYGMQTADFKQSFHFGKPLIDAYELQNELELYGVILHHTTEQRLNMKKNIENNGFVSFAKYHVPMKYSKINHYIINWAQEVTKEKNNPYDLLTNFYHNVSGKPRKYVDNTLDFVRWVIEKEAELKQKKS